jgi:hypothetical protein
MEIPSNPSSGKSAWVQLYEARQLMGNIESRPPGRPPSSVPRRKVGVTLSQGEIQELEVWQERLSVLMRRKVSVGETVGIITRICTARLTNVSAEFNYLNLGDLVEKMIEK